MCLQLNIYAAIGETTKCGNAKEGHLKFFKPVFMPSFTTAHASSL